MDREALELRDYLSILWARKWTILAVMLVTTAVASGYSLSRTPVYTSSAEVVVLPVSFVPAESSATFIPINMTTEVQVANSFQVGRTVLEELEGRGLPAGTMSISQVVNAETLVFTSESSNPVAARATAQGYAQAYLQLRRNNILDELEGARRPYELQISVIDGQLEEIRVALEGAEEGDRQILTAQFTSLLSQKVALWSKLNDLVEPESVNVGRVLRAASLPGSPTSPNPVRDGTVGAIVGLALGMGMAFVRDRLDEPVRGRGDLETRTGAPVLAFIPSAGWGKFFKRDDGTLSTTIEAFKTLRVRLLHIATQRSLTTILVTSSFPGEGKTTVTARLGRALAEAGRRVVIVSADLRRPRLQTHFPPRTDGAGLAQLLKRTRSARRTLAATDNKNLWVLHAGRSLGTVDPSDLLGSDSMKDALEDLRGIADFVIIDTPPLLTSPDVLALAPLTDGALLVVDARLAQQPAADQARHELQQVGVPILGLVVTRHDPSRFRAFGAGYGYYVEDQPPGSEAASSTLRAVGSGRSVPPVERDSEDVSQP